MSLLCASLAKVNPTSEKIEGKWKSAWERGTIRRGNPELLKEGMGTSFPYFPKYDGRSYYSNQFHKLNAQEVKP